MKNFLLLFLLVISLPGYVQVSLYEFAETEQEQRYRNIIANLRCLQCQHQSLADTNSELGNDLKQIVREQIIAGKTDQQILDFMTQRYGDFVLMRPAWKPSNWLLWLAPGIFLLLAVGGFFAWYQKHKKSGVDNV